MNTQVQDVGAEKDAITSLRAPTHFGRPNWDRVFPSIADRHPDTDVGVVSALSSSSTFPKFSLLPARQLGFQSEDRELCGLYPECHG